MKCFSFNAEKARARRGENEESLGNVIRAMVGEMPKDRDLREQQLKWQKWMLKQQKQQMKVQETSQTQLTKVIEGNTLLLKMVQDMKEETEGEG